MMISICLPTYNNKGTKHNESYNNITMLLQLFESIKKQTYKDYELIISDHSIDDSVKKVCDEWQNDINIKYYQFTENYGSCEANLNNAIKKATGKYIKPMLQDDYFYDSTALEKMVDEIEKDDKNWIVTGCIRIRENNCENLFGEHIPTNMNESVLIGNNVIGSPIVIMHKNDGMLYDEYLIWLMDVDFYYRMFKKYGLPHIMKDIFFVSRLRADGISDTMVTKQIMEDEVKYCRDKYVDGLKDIKNYPAMYERIINANLLKK